jgi:hypothetical protein
MKKTKCKSKNKKKGIAVRVEDSNVWLHSEAISQLFQKDRRTIQEHLKNIFADGEQDENSVCRKFRHTAADGKNYQVKFYSLEAIIAVGYRTDSKRTIEFRKWATKVLSEFSIKGYVMDKNRLINNQVSYQKTTTIYLNYTHRQAQKHKVCKNCQKQIEMPYIFCPYCGNEI